MGLFSSLFSKSLSTDLTVTSSNGFHLRPVAQFVSVAKKYPCRISASFKDKEVNAKGVNSLLGLSLEQGDSFTVICKGKDAERALQSLIETFNVLMQDDKEISVIEKKGTQYEGPVVTGEIIYTGIAIAPLYHYKEQIIHKKSQCSFQEAYKKSFEELAALYENQKDKSDAAIYLAQKELLVSLKEECNTLDQLKEKIKTYTSKLLDTKLESKITDYRDILQRIEKHLGIEVSMVLPDKASILLADDLLPSQIGQLVQSTVSGVILQETSLNSHTAILLRAEGITSLIADSSALTENTTVILDGHAGLIVTDPSEEDFKKAEQRLKEDQKVLNTAKEKRFEQALTKEGKVIKVVANVTDITSAEQAKEEGAEGIGLLRTEFLFKEEKPTFEMQRDAYKKIFDTFDDITVRTLDVGGDKALPYIDLPKEDNPFLGIRGVRLFDTHPGIMEEQLHAIFTAAENRTVKVMFPMVSTVDEFSKAKRFSQKVAEEHQIDISNILFGIMIEVPSVLFL
ncbi:MAG TPA: HPr family phosphocarrier protein, partial [Epsilonproteobacteria bacterium]|nr:HPr family phosphocarrier protein [Campylobacterota bacterium]